MGGKGEGLRIGIRGGLRVGEGLGVGKKGRIKDGKVDRVRGGNKREG